MTFPPANTRDYPGAEERFVRFLQRRLDWPPGDGQQSLRWTARYGLALSHREQGRCVEAEALWQALLAEARERAAATSRRPRAPARRCIA